MLQSLGAAAPCGAAGAWGVVVLLGHRRAHEARMVGPASGQPRRRGRDVTAAGPLPPLLTGRAGSPDRWRKGGGGGV